MSQRRLIRRLGPSQLPAFKSHPSPTSPSLHFQFRVQIDLGSCLRDTFATEEAGAKLHHKPSVPAGSDGMCRRIRASESEAKNLVLTLSVCKLAASPSAAVCREYAHLGEYAYKGTGAGKREHLV